MLSSLCISYLMTISTMSYIVFCCVCCKTVSTYRIEKMPRLKPAIWILCVAALVLALTVFYCPESVYQIEVGQSTTTVWPTVVIKLSTTKRSQSTITVQPTRVTKLSTTKRSQSTTTEWPTVVIKPSTTKRSKSGTVFTTLGLGCELRIFFIMDGPMGVYRLGQGGQDPPSASKFLF